MKDVRKALAALIASCLASLQAHARPPLPEAGSAEDAALEWVKRDAVEIAGPGKRNAGEDFAWLERIVGGARAIALGEGTHGASEFLLLRNRVFEHLAAHMGFTALVVETDFAAARAANEFVLGRREGDAMALASKVFSYSGTSLRENAQLLLWMRDENRRRAKGKALQLYGLDAMGDRTTPGPAEGKPLSDALDYLSAMEPSHQLLSELRALLPLSRESHAALDRDRRDALTASLSDLVALYERRRVKWIARSSADAYEFAYRQARNARHVDADLRAAGWWSIGAQGELDQRDFAMAENLQWALDREGQRGRVMVFAHNVHLRKAAMPEGQPDVFTSLGEQAAVSLPGGLTTIATVYGEGRICRSGKLQELGRPRPGSVNALMSRAGLARYAIDLRQLPAGSAAARWFSAPQRFRNADTLYFEWVPVTSFDALVFFDTVSPARGSSAPCA